MRPISAYAAEQRAFSRETFGPGKRRAGILQHIRKELVEVESAEGEDLLYEWVDVMILALDGAWRAGFSPDEIEAALWAKLARNRQRTWPDWRDVPDGQAIEHVREMGE